MRVASIAVAGMLVVSCGGVGNSVVEGLLPTPENQIMLVRKDPPSFGFQRLTIQSRTYPDLAVFVNQKGLPDFLAETHNSDRHYFIIYYLADREAFACRTRTPGSKSVEFAGPYPITDREYKVLDTFRKDPTRAPARF
ncbi:MAG: hypothetical protein EOP88_15115 [Verrucomicrobiaceae bacterium]|nr:MAG: hypothetical protein EOP88_15115 [Verrucomicrobiaceae bacterium]